MERCSHCPNDNKNIAKFIIKDSDIYLCKYHADSYYIQHGIEQTLSSLISLDYKYSDEEITSLQDSAKDIMGYMNKLKQILFKNTEIFTKRINEELKKYTDQYDLIIKECKEILKSGVSSLDQKIKFKRILSMSINPYIKIEPFNKYKDIIDYYSKFTLEEKQYINEDYTDRDFMIIAYILKLIQAIYIV